MEIYHSEEDVQYKAHGKYMSRLTKDLIWFLVVHIDCLTDIGPLTGSLRTKAVLTCCQLRISGELVSCSSLHIQVPACF